jgi:hypothetical protein
LASVVIDSFNVAYVVINLLPVASVVIYSFTR